MPLGRLLLRTSTVNKVVSRNTYTAFKPDPSKPNMLRVGLAFGSTAVLWALFGIGNLVKPKRPTPVVEAVIKKCH